eukprot:COSAG02_NODE_28838_length_581_cov_1.049793_2_plen_46_part_01
MRVCLVWVDYDTLQFQQMIGMTRTEVHNSNTAPSNTIVSHLARQMS